MSYWKYGLCGGAILVWIGGIPLASAQQLNPQQIQLIRDTAASICNTVVDAKGRKTDLQIQGDVKAQLNGLVGKIVDVGGSGKGAISREEFEGLSRDATATAMQDDRGCRERVFNKMFDKLGSATTLPPRTFSVCMGNGGGPSCAGDQVYYTCAQYRAIGGGSAQSITELGNRLCKYNDSGQEKLGTASVVHLSSVGGGECGWTRFSVTCTYP